MVMRAAPADDEVDEAVTHSAVEPLCNMAIAKATSRGHGALIGHRAISTARFAEEDLDKDRDGLDCKLLRLSEDECLLSCSDLAACLVSDLLPCRIVACNLLLKA